MTQEDHCFHCGAKLTMESPEGLCPKCLMRSLMQSNAAITLYATSLTEGPGTKIGRYELLERLGEGGMGLVYLAEQKEPVKRKVALKIVKLGMDTKQVVARFEAERQTLALLEHPNIAHVFDAGTTDSGRPYFVMEYVKGKSITKYCDEKKLCIEKRLKLFRQVCEGIHHAHQKGIIHRDIKPSNILVSVQDDKPVPKIIDFGIAKAITQPLTEKTWYTEHSQLLGTPEYMSPEQADMAYQDVDTRSDIYSLGVLLYELLTGATPFDAKRLREGGIDHIQQVIREEQPRTPSVRLTSLGDKAKAVAERRRTQIITLTRRLHRELEWIPMKAMRKDRTRRYRSASELADDIRNYLTGSPLIAGPESTIYRARKFVRKHVGSVATGALLFIVVVLGLVVSIVMGCRAEQARKHEAAARKQVEQALVRAENAERIAQEQRKLAEEQHSLAEKLAEDYRRSLYVNRIALADVAYHSGNVNRLRELLNLSPKDLRGWEWYRLNHILDQSYLTLRGHAAAVLGMAVSPDGKQIASCSRDKTIKIWDAVTGAELMTLRGHEGGVWSVAYSPDGSKIASGSVDGAIIIWDAATGNEMMTLRGHDSWVWAIAFSPNSDRIVSGSNNDKTVKVWDVSTGAEVMTLRGHTYHVCSVAFSPDGQHIASGSIDRTIKVWDTRSGAEIMTLKGHKGEVSSVSFSPDCKHIVSCSRDSTIKIWDAATGVELMTLHGHNRWVGHVSFSPDGSKIVSGSMDNTIKVWDAITGKEVKTLRGHSGWVGSVAFSPDGKSIISASEDKTAKVWDSVTSGEETALHGHNGRVWGIVFSPDGERIASSGWDKTIKVWDVATGTEVMTLEGHKKGVSSAGFSPEGTHIISGSGDNTIKMWDIETGAEVMTLRGHKDTVHSTAFSPDGKHIISGSWDKTVKAWDVATGAEVMTLEGHKGRITSVSLSPDGKHVVSASEDKTIKVWNAVTGSEVMTLRGHEGSVLCVSFSPDNKYIASGSLDKTIKMWDATTGVELMTLRGHKNLVSCVIFSPDGKRLITGGYYDGIKIWDVETGTELMAPYGHGPDLNSLVFSPDGKTLAMAGDSGIRLWESETPAGGYEPRRAGAAARKLVDKLHKEYGRYSEVMDKLKANRTLDEPVRKIALQIASSRLGDDIGKFTNVLEVIASPDKDIDAYRQVLQEAEMANQLDPNNPEILTVLGIAQYRVGTYREAIKTLTRAEKMYENKNDPVAATGAFIARAMASYKLGQDEHAEVALQRLRDVRKEERIAEDKKVQAFLAEAEKLLSGENGGRR